jgi:NDP-sugar pyrophosphorylase family protein
VLDEIDGVIDGLNIRNRSHAIETLAMLGLGKNENKNAVVLLGGSDALNAIPATNEYLKQLKDSGFDQVNIAVGFLGDKVKNKLGDGKELGLCLDYNAKGDGSGGAIKLLENKLRKTFVVFNTQDFYDINLNFLLSYHKEHKSIATIATNNLETYEGIYIFEPEIFNYIPKEFSMLEETIIPNLLKDGRAIVYPLVVN